MDDQKQEIESLKQERLTQLRRLDDQIDAIPGNHSTNRRKMKVEQASERADIDQALKHYAKELEQLTQQQHSSKLKVIQQEVHTGPIIYIAQVFGAKVDDATKWVIFALIGVFDPLAVVLTLGLNMAIVKQAELQQVKQGIKEIDDVKEMALSMQGQLDEDQQRYSARMDEPTLFSS